MNAVQGDRIWGQDQVHDRQETRLEFPYLIRFQGEWYCSFREGDIHMNHPSGRGRVIRSSDGEEWESVALLDWDCGDVRELRLSVTAEEFLMANTSIYFVSEEPREIGYSSSGRPYDNHYQLESSGTPSVDLEYKVTRQSVTWLSPDGENWSSAYACPSGINTWRWDVTWFNGMGYSIGYGGRDSEGALYRTRDGKSWRILMDRFFPEGQGNEATLAFGRDSTAYCLLRGGPSRAMLGIGEPPYYQNWTWRQTSVVLAEKDKKLMPSDDFLNRDLGGPKIIRLSDGRLLAIGRADGRVTLFWVDPELAVLTKFLEVDGTSYPGVAEYEGELWVTYGVGDASELYLVKAEIPSS